MCRPASLSAPTRQAVQSDSLQDARPGPAGDDDAGRRPGQPAQAGGDLAPRHPPGHHQVLQVVVSHCNWCARYRPRIERYRLNGSRDNLGGASLPRPGYQAEKRNFDGI